jgi:hypothetical protein
MAESPGSGGWSNRTGRASALPRCVGGTPRPGVMAGCIVLVLVGLLAIVHWAAWRSSRPTPGGRHRTADRPPPRASSCAATSGSLTSAITKTWRRHPGHRGGRRLVMPLLAGTAGARYSWYAAGTTSRTMMACTGSDGLSTDSMRPVRGDRRPRRQAAKAARQLGRSRSALVAARGSGWHAHPATRGHWPGLTGKPSQLAA